MNKAREQFTPVWALGAMSGTSMDGVDVAMVQTDGEQIFEFGTHAYRPYSDSERACIAAAMGQWHGPQVDAAGDLVDRVHIEALREVESASLIGYHGQTLSHDPKNGRTLQVGNGDAVAQALNTPVVWDFRTADVQMGGEGAPLSPFFHFACAKWFGADQPIAFLNLGGVGNLTYIDPTYETPEEDGALLAFDTGPANAPINDAMQARLGQPFDRDGAVAAQGKVETGALELFLAEPYFARMPPKSLDRNDFSEMIQLVNELSDADAVATLTAMSAAAVVGGVTYLPKPPSMVLVTGGGRLNPVLMEMLKVSLDCSVRPIEAVGLDGDMLEAQAFAHLAVRVKRGLPTSCRGTTGVRAAVGGGTISDPAQPQSLS